MYTLTDHKFRKGDKVNITNNNPYQGGTSTINYYIRGDSITNNTFQLNYETGFPGFDSGSIEPSTGATTQTNVSIKVQNMFTTSSNHGLEIDQIVNISAGTNPFGTSPTHTTTTNYYVVTKTDTTFKLASSSRGAILTGSSTSEITSLTIDPHLNLNPYFYNITNW